MVVRGLNESRFSLGAGIISESVWLAGAPIWAIIGGGLTAGIAGGAWKEITMFKEHLDKPCFGTFNIQ
jgi:hypothetical protein